MNRKEFLRKASLISALPIVGCSNSKLLNFNDRGGRPTVFDLHAHPGVSFYRGSPDYPGDESFIKTIEMMNEHDITGAFFSLVSDMPLLKITQKGVIPVRSFEKGEGWKEFERQLNDLTELLQSSPANICNSYGQILRSEDVAAVLACEGGDFLEGNTENVIRAYEAGIRSIQIVHYAPNELGDLQTHEPRHGGLSTAGKSIVNKMNELGMVIDVAHASFDTVKGVVETSAHPVILSHSLLKDGSDSPVAARAISEDHARLIAQNGGVIGAWPSGFSNSIEAFVDHTLRLIDVVGIDHVGLGTDMDANFQPVLKNYGEVKNWSEALIVKGLSKDESIKVTGGNAMRVLRKVLHS